MKILQIMIQVGLRGPDHISIQTDLPESIWPFGDTGQTLSLDTANGRGVEYVRTHFPDVPTMVMNHQETPSKWVMIEDYD